MALSRTALAGPAAELSHRPHPSLKDTLRYVEQEFKEATTFPIVIIAIEHDAPGKALPKKKTNKA